MAKILHKTGGFQVRAI